MTTSTDRIEDIFQDDLELQADALEMLAQRRIRNAAEKAWGATKRATDALILARTGEEPERTPETGAGLRMLESLDEAEREANLQSRYYCQRGTLHGHCFHMGFCDPLGGDGAPDSRDGQLHRRRRTPDRRHRNNAGIQYGLRPRIPLNPLRRGDTTWVLPASLEFELDLGDMADSVRAVLCALASELPFLHQ